MIRKITTLILGLMLLAATQTKASHLSAAEFTYSHISGNDYLISLYLYRDCNGVGMATSVNINMSSVSCGISGQTALLTQLGAPTLVTAIPGGQTTCQGGVIQGYEEYIYQATVTMPAQCADWLLSYSVCCRNAAITNLVSPSSQSAYIESTMNNLLVNNSPHYYIDPVFYGSMGNNFSVALGGSDPDGDQLVFQLAAPLHDAVTPITFSPGLSVAQPLDIMPGTNIAFSTTTGQFNCILAVGAQIVVFDIIVHEYRNGNLLASHRRSFQILPINLGGYSMPVPTVNTTANGTVLDPYTMEYTTPGQPFSFSMLFADPDSSDVITYNALYSSIQTRFPNATVTSSNPSGGLNELKLDVTIPTPAPALFNILVEENGFLQHSFTYQLVDASATSVGIIKEEATKLRVYPNPMETATTFEVLEGNYEALNLQIFDITGRSIHTQTVQGTQQIQFHRNNLPAGVYSYQLLGDGELIQADLLEVR